MGRRNPPAESGVYQTAVTISTRAIRTAKGADLVCVDITSNQPISFSREDNPDEMRHVYGLSIAIHPHQGVYVDTGDPSFILVQCSDVIGCFIASTPLIFEVSPHAPVLGLEYPSSYYTFCFLDAPIHIVTEKP